MDWLQDPIPPMLATLVDTIPEGNYSYEVKWDGIRAILRLNNGEIQIYSRNQNELTGKFPELQDVSDFDAETAILDGEIVCLNEEGKPAFSDILKRVQTQNKSKIDHLSVTLPATFYLFDCLFLNGEPMINEPFEFRHRQLGKILTSESHYKISELFEDGESLFRAAKENNLEGILAKHNDSRYLVGRRSPHWQKVKIRKEAACVIIGYTTGKGDRGAYFGSLHVAAEENGYLVYRGKVGTGFSDEKMREIHERLIELDEVQRPEFAPVDKKTTWVEWELLATVSYTELTDDNIFRAPVFEGLETE